MNPYHSQPRPPAIDYSKCRYEGRQLIEPNGIRHVDGCHGTGGCRCEGYRNLNPHLFPAERYIGPLQAVREYVPKSANHIDAALLSKNVDDLDKAADKAFYELLELREPYERGTAEFQQWDERVQQVLGAMTDLGMR